jgi:hypothetical protein
MNYLHKSRPIGIDAISKVIALVVWMEIDLIIGADYAKKESARSKDLAMPRLQE